MNCWRESFNYPRDLIYLNSGSMSLSPIPVLSALQKEKDRFELNPTEGLFGAWSKMWSTQRKLADFFKADPRHLFLRSNVTHVMNDLIMALKLPPRSEILISDIEYGAVVRICQYKAKTEGHDLRVLKLHEKGQDPATVTEDQLLQRFEESLSERTKLVMLSHVMTGSGLILPVEKMAKILRARGIFFAVDGAHGAGALPLDFSKTEVDLYGTNLHKWMMGPKGSGFGYVAPEMREYLEPKFAGWTTSDVHPHFEVFGEGDPWTSRWMICSTHNFADFYGIDETLKFWEQVGPANIWKRHRELAEFAANTISEMTTWKCLSRYPSPEQRSPLVAFQLPPALSSRGFELFKHLQSERKLVISMTIIQNEWCLRVSPNIYNTEEEIFRAAEILKSLS